MNPKVIIITTFDINDVLYFLGEPKTVELNVRPAEDYPLDLYFVMDLSYSMSDDLLNLIRLGDTLGKF